MYDSILIPTDGSPAADRAVEYAVDLAAQYGSELHVLYVLAPSGYGSRGGGAETVTLTERDGRAVLANVAARARDADVDVRTAMARGSPPEAIVTYAGDIDPDLVVVGRVGADGSESLGHVSGQLLRRCRWPLLVEST